VVADAFLYRLSQDAWAEVHRRSKSGENSAHHRADSPAEDQ
jgi:hypothetical protein